ncbi:integrase core domain-containing protein, partial [Alkalibacterium sp. 20]|uniref:integrase core domain-containing protein n=1 Tax=Alkalibacterium sp. 20 TaxID=1798803 RepID=UPI000A549AB9
FFGHLKDEIYYETCTSVQELRLVIDDYMDYYNNERGQWKLKKLTPVSYRSQLLLQPAA